MIKNETKHINPSEIENITAQAKINNFYLVILDGRKIQTKQKYIDIMYKEFFFPEWDSHSYDGYMDWIRDLGWLIDKGSKGFVLIIDYYKSFLEQEGPIYNYCLDDGREVKTFNEYLNLEGFKDITNHWEYEVIEHGPADGPVSFNIYLVDR